MHFTREPIIETVITPRDGNRLVVRSSKGDKEEYSVEALEVVSFNNALFFRSTERPNSFLLPVTDYEVVETKELRSALKVASGDRSIRIGGGREASVRPPQPREQQEEESSEGVEEREQPSNERFDKKRDNNRRRRGRRREPQNEQQKQEHVSEERSNEPELAAQTVDKESVEVAPSFISKLFPPPPVLIKETLSRYKIVEEEAPSQKQEFPEEMLEEPDEEISGMDEETIPEE